MLNHIIWDWNGTLLDDVWLCTDIINHLLEKYNLPTITIEKYKELFDFPVKGYYQKLGFDFKKVPFEKVGTEFIEIYNKRVRECKLQKDAEHVLKHYHSWEVPQSILSARKQEELESDLEFYGLTKYVTNIVGLKNHYASGKLENAKKLLKKIGEKPADILIIGDTTHDFEIAKKLRLKRIILDIGHQSSARLKKLDAIIHTNLYEVAHPKISESTKQFLIDNYDKIYKNITKK